MAHQFDSVCGNAPTPQIMIQLIGCIATSPQGDDSKQSVDLGICGIRAGLIEKKDWS